MSKLLRVLFNEEATGGGSENAEETAIKDKETGSEDSNSEVEKYKNEAKAAFGKRDEIKRERDKLKGELQAIKDGEKIKSGKTEELLSEKEQELKDAQAKLDEAEAIKAENDSLKAGIRKGFIDKLPEEHRGKAFLEKMSIEELKEYAKLNSAPDAEDVDSGAKADGGSDIRKLSDAQLGRAKEMFPGVSDKKKLTAYFFEIEDKKKKKEEQTT